MAPPLPGPACGTAPSRSAAPRRRTAPFAAAAALALALTGCMDTGPELGASFAEQTQEPSGMPMPDARLDDDPEGPTPRREPRGENDDPCAIDDAVLAACLPEITALASPGPGRGVAATADGVLWLVVPGTQPRPVGDAGMRVRQLLVSPTAEEDGQLFLLRVDGSVARLTLLPGGGSDLKELPEYSASGTLALIFDARGRLDTLLAGPPDIEVLSVCHGPSRVPPLMTVRLEGEPMLAQWSAAGLIEPVGGVDLDDSLGGCAVAEDQVVVAVPNAHKVVRIAVTPPAGPMDSWRVAGSPETVLDGEYGRVRGVALVAGEEGPEFWGATANKADGTQASESDERVFRLPSGGSSGGSPD